MKQLKYWIPALLWTICILIASLLSSRSLKKLQLETIFEIDKIIHFGMYFGLSILLSYGFYKSSVIWNKLKLFLVSCFISSSLGIIVEILQKEITQTRSFDYFDIIANIIGALIGSAIFLIRIK